MMVSEASIVFGSPNVLRASIIIVSKHISRCTHGLLIQWAWRSLGKHMEMTGYESSQVTSDAPTVALMSDCDPLWHALWRRSRLWACTSRITDNQIHVVIPHTAAIQTLPDPQEISFLRFSLFNTFDRFLSDTLDFSHNLSKLAPPPPHTTTTPPNEQNFFFWYKKWVWSYFLFLYSSSPLPLF